MPNSDSIPKQVINLTGQHFGRLIVLSYIGTDKHQKSRWLCRCICGTEKTVIGGDLRSGKVVSCGCLRRSVLATSNLSHEHTRNGQWSKLYSTHVGMVQRCFNPNDQDSKDYRERGITVCAGLRDFPTFVKEAGEPPTLKHTIDRINNDGNYSCGKCPHCLANEWPKNIRWATRKEQAQNRRPRHSKS